MRHPSLDLGRLAFLGPRLSIEVYDETPSTNPLLADRARAGAGEGLVIVTEHQTAGRGRLDRAWQTPPRSALTFSVLLRPDVPPARWPWLPLVAGLAVSGALRELGYPAGVKWPNDVLLTLPEGERKVCGILVERVETPTGPAAVVGIGLNSSMSAAELPLPTATSLAVAGGVEPDRTQVLVAVLSALTSTYDAWLADPAGIAAAYTAASITLGRRVRAELPGGGVLEGIATRIDELGRVVVAGPDGESAVGAGDVVHLRSVG
jgi:BirA family transcriptional regulator, biotin operon repressor / biotin---[acetyl-CoA-carboxylase] ligase